jgi:transposase
MSHGYRISNYCQSDIPTRKLDGINDKIKTIKRKAFGSNHLQYLAVKIIAATATDS